MDLSALISHKKNMLPFAAELTGDDIIKLTALLNEKNNALRYPAFLALQARSRIKDDVYPCLLYTSRCV